MMIAIFYLSLFFFALIAFLNIRLAGWLLLMLLPTYLLRTQIWFIPTTWLELAIYILALITFISLVRSAQLKNTLLLIWRNYKPLWWAVLFWFLTATIATIISPDLRLSAGVLKGWWFDPILFLLVSLILIKNKSDLKYVITGLLGSGALVAIWGLLEYIFNFGIQADGLLNSVYKPANYVAMLVVPIIFLGWGELKNSFTLRRRILISFLISLQLVALWYTKSYGGFLGLVAGIIILLVFISDKKIKKIATIIFLFLCLAGSLIIAGQSKFQKIINLTERNSLTTRLQIWEISLELLKQKPILGVGLGNFYQPYRTQAFAMFQPPLEWEVVKAHNLFLNIWLEVGLLGLLAFSYLIFIYGKTVYKLLHQNLDSLDWWYLAGSLSALIATLAHGLLDTPYFKNDLSILFYFILFLPAILLYFRTKSID